MELNEQTVTELARNTCLASTDFDGAYGIGYVEYVFTTDELMTLAQALIKLELV